MGILKKGPLGEVSFHKKAFIKVILLFYLCPVAINLRGSEPLTSQATGTSLYFYPPTIPTGFTEHVKGA